MRAFGIALNGMICVISRSDYKCTFVYMCVQVEMRIVVVLLRFGFVWTCDVYFVWGSGERGEEEGLYWVAVAVAGMGEWGCGVSVGWEENRFFFWSKDWEGGDGYVMVIEW